MMISYVDWRLPFIPRWLPKTHNTTTIYLRFFF